MALGGVASGHRTVLVAPRPAGAPLELVSVCLDGAPGQGRAAVAIFVCERSSSSSLSDRELQTLYGLTPAEARVARLLASGRSVAAIARELRVSPNTVRTQLKATFAKTDTCQQSELAALIARSVAAVVC
jgi:DNA-binding CsgD family transcriptional regulator